MERLYLGNFTSSFQPSSGGYTGYWWLLVANQLLSHPDASNLEVLRPSVFINFSFNKICFSIEPIRQPVPIGIRFALHRQTVFYY